MTIECEVTITCTGAAGLVGFTGKHLTRRPGHARRYAYKENVVMEKPKVFISHASEDKERFVLDFAAELRAMGIDAWVDRWEMLPGDSLVDKIFEEGIKQATAFIIVLSQFSVRKKWVREELNAAVVKRLEKGTKIIPVLIDEVEVPESLKSTVWIEIPDVYDHEPELARIVQAIFGVYNKPPLGEPPKYAQLSIDSLPGLTRTDTLILKLAYEYELEQGYNFIETDELYPKAKEHEIDLASFAETLEILDSRGYIKGKKVADGTIIAFRIATYGFSEYARSFIPELNDIVDQTAFFLINQLKPHSAIDTVDLAEKIELPKPLVNHIIEMLKLHRYVDTDDLASGDYAITRVSPELKRTLEA